jgi:hypothetical protein
LSCLHRICGGAAFCRFRLRIQPSAVWFDAHDATTDSGGEVTAGSVHAARGSARSAPCTAAGCESKKERKQTGAAPECCQLRSTAGSGRPEPRCADVGAAGGWMEEKWNKCVSSSALFIKRKNTPGGLSCAQWWVISGRRGASKCTCVRIVETGSRIRPEVHRHTDRRAERGRRPGRRRPRAAD